MNPNDPVFCQPPGELTEAVRAALSSGRFLSEIISILNDAQSTFEELETRCNACGKCCKFDLVDHKLFVTVGELGVVVAESPPLPAVSRRCCYQQNHLCTIRKSRPLGCRAYHCDSRIFDVNSCKVETYHKKLVQAHDRHGIPYLYVEFISGIDLLRNSTFF